MHPYFLFVIDTVAAYAQDYRAPVLRNTDSMIHYFYVFFVYRNWYNIPQMIGFISYLFTRG